MHVARDGVFWLRQSWRTALFAHWEVPAEVVRTRVPQPLLLDTWQGRAFVSLVAVDVHRSRLRGLVPLPGLRPYLQLNLRTYVSHEGRPGVLFLGAWSTLALPALASTLAFGVPARRVAMEVDRDDGELRFRAGLAGGASEELALHVVTDGEPYLAPEGTLDEWLHERYRGFGQRGRALISVDVRHRPWRLSAAHLVDAHLAPGVIPIPLRTPTLLRVAQASGARLIGPQRVARARSRTALALRPSAALFT